MKVLMLTPYLPYPLFSGGQTRSYNLIKSLSENHEITLFSLIKDDTEKKYIPELQKYCRKVSVFKRSKTPWTLRNILLTAFGPYPFLVMRNYSPSERKAVKEELLTGNYDLIHAETFYTMPHIPSTSVPILLVEQTIEYLVYKHYAGEQAPFLIRPIIWVDVALKLRFWETYFWKRSQRVVAMSQSDSQLMRELVKDLKIDIVPNGIDVEYFSAKKRKEESFPKILYVGNFAWLQNAEAVEVLVNEVWPEIKKEVPNCQLWIVGKNITGKIKNYASESIQITEGLPDIRDAYLTSSLLLVPIKGPGGTRLKVLEAMASGLPVVTTPVGAEGLGVTNGKHALISDDFKELAKLAVKLIKNKKLAQKLGLAAKEFVEKNYSWSKSAAILDRIYKEVCGKN
jgi:glycosyltransferase involved in cell wall biosynthesis